MELQKGQQNTTPKIKDYLFLTEIFYSIQGESNDAGYPCVFVRLSGCDLRCTWCDTEYSFGKGKKTTFDEILAQVREYGVKRVEITGGEPLLQIQVVDLMAILVKAGYRVLIETGGHRDVSEVPREVVKIMDIKCPDSGMGDTFVWENLDYLGKEDVLKFVVASRKDYEFARNTVRERNLNPDQVHFSVVREKVDPHDVANWMLEDRVEVKLQLQLHKFLDVE